MSPRPYAMETIATVPKQFNIVSNFEDSSMQKIIFEVERNGDIIEKYFIDVSLYTFYAPYLEKTIVRLFEDLKTKHIFARDFLIPLFKR